MHTSGHRYLIKAIEFCALSIFVYIPKCGNRAHESHQNLIQQIDYRTLEMAKLARSSLKLVRAVKSEIQISNSNRSKRN